MRCSITMFWSAVIGMVGLLVGACAFEPVPVDSEGFDGGIGETEQALAIPGVKLRTVAGGRYVGAQNNGGGQVTATATAAQVWETFTVDDLNGGAFVSGDRVTIRAGSGHYFQARNGGGSSLNAATFNTLDWERFRVVKLGGTGEIRNGDTIGLQTFTGHWVCALQGGGGAVVADRSAFSTWEQFVITGLSAGTPKLPVVTRSGPTSKARA